MQGIKGHISMETAHITFGYPFGSNRCIRREWIETATKGAKKHEQRSMEQTAAKPWIFEYTRRWNEDQTAANQWALDEMNAGRVPFNNPHASQYSNVIVMYLEPLDDNSGREGIKYDRLTYYSKPEHFAEFRAKWTEYLNEDQSKLITMTEIVCRRYNGGEWAKWDEANPKT